MIAWLKALNPKVWFAIALLVLFAGYTAAVYRAGGAGPRAKLSGLQEAIRIVHLAQVKEDARREDAHQALIKEKDNERLQAIADTTLSWDSYVAGLRTAPSGASEDKKPVRIASQRCDNATGNDAVSAAVSGFRDEARSAVADFEAETGAAVGGFRAEVAGQLKQGQLNTDQLLRVQDALAKEQQINH